MTVTAPTIITTTPSRINSPVTLSNDVDSFLTDQPIFVTEANQFASDLIADSATAAADLAAMVTNANYQGAWSAAVSYSVGESVLHGGSYYLSKVNSNLNNTPPGSSDASWEIVPIPGATNTLNDMGGISGSTDLALNFYQYFSCTAAGNTTFTVSGAAEAGLSKRFSLRIFDADLYTITFPGSFQNVQTPLAANVLIEFAQYSTTDYVAVRQVELT